MYQNFLRQFTDFIFVEDALPLPILFLFRETAILRWPSGRPPSGRREPLLSCSPRAGTAP